MNMMIEDSSIVHQEVSMGSWNSNQAMELLDHSESVLSQLGSDHSTSLGDQVHISQLILIMKLHCPAQSLSDVTSIFVKEQPPLNHRGLTKSIMMIAAQAALTLLAINGSKVSTSSMSSNAEILFCSAVTCNTIGFFCCLFGILLCGRKPGVAARIITGIGYIITTYGFIALMGMLLPVHLKLWITGGAGIAFFPALAFAIFMKD